MPAANDAAGQLVMNNQMLLAARQALAVGDVRRATLLVDQAKAIQVMRGPNDDNPQNVEQLVRKCTDLNMVSPDRKDTEGFRLAYARLLLEQAEGLMRRGDLDESERLAIESSRQRVTFGALETKPEMLMQRIAAIRRQGSAAAMAPGMASGGAFGRDSCQRPIHVGGGRRRGMDQRASWAVYDSGQRSDAQRAGVGHSAFSGSHVAASLVAPSAAAPFERLGRGLAHACHRRCAGRPCPTPGMPTLEWSITCAARRRCGPTTWKPRCSSSAGRPSIAINWIRPSRSG